MGRLVVIEGLDGAGKRTLTERLVTALTGVSVATIAFPRYGASVPADLASDALHGRMGDVVDSVHGMALLFALDRLAAKDHLVDLLAGHDIVLADRYVASNAAYGAARLHQGAGGEFVAWVRALEIERFGLPVPHAHLLLRVPVEVAASRAAHRENREARARDTFESDDGLQARCARVYDELAETDWLAPWHVVDGTVAQDMPVLAKVLLA
ncbi:MAG TPA: dTMP kinase [Pseudonocardiaceae bacterium]|nr:dTMP kinase [Pseudonocardiaceae bacterium]